MATTTTKPATTGKLPGRALSPPHETNEKVRIVSSRGLLKAQIRDVALLADRAQQPQTIDSQQVQLDARAMAEYIKSALDVKYDCVWQVVVGKCFGASVSPTCRAHVQLVVGHFVLFVFNTDISPVD